MTTTDGLHDQTGPVADDDAAVREGEPLGPSSEPTEDAATEPVAPPFYAGEWRGAALYACPAGDYPARSVNAVLRHIALAHRAPEEPDIDTRARQAGIILAHR
jgi:hypothetical protein